jgi:hypothetical protein
MVAVTHASTHSALPVILGPAAVAGLCAGGISGLVVGTPLFPILGTGVGALAGIVLGLVFGVVDGLVLAATARWTHSRLAFGVVAAAVSGVCAVPPAAAVSGGWSHVFVLGSGALAFVCWCVLLGAVLGPAGARLSRPSRTPDLSWCATTGRCAARGALVAAGFGAAAGLILGLFAYPPTAPVALVEGAILAAGPGAVVGAIAGLLKWQCRARMVQ